MATRRTGFTLIETLVAVAILATTIIATGALFARLPVNNREARDQSIALKIARAQIEALRAAGYEALPATGPFANELLSSLASSSASVTVAAYDTKTKQVEVRVTWAGNGNASRSVSLTSLIAQDSKLP